MREEAEKKIDRRYLALLSLVALTLVLSLLVRPAGPARAAFPGQNGNIVFVSDRDRRQRDPQAEQVSHLQDQAHQQHGGRFRTQRFA